MSKEFSQRQKFIESCNQLVLRLEEKELNENIVTKLFDNIRTVKEIGDFYKKLLTNNKALQYYLTNLKNSIVKNINQINNDFLDKLLTTLNTTPSLKNLIYLSTLACATFYYIKSYQSIPNLETWFNSILNSQLVNNITIDSIFQFFEMLIKIVGSIALVYQILIEPYKNEILSMVGSFIILKKNQMTESRFTNYNKSNMKKVMITESQLRGMVRKMLNEMGGYSSLDNTTFEKRYKDINNRNKTLQNTFSSERTTLGNEIDGPIYDLLKSLDITKENLPNIKAGVLNGFNRFAKELMQPNVSQPQSFQQKANFGNPKSNLEESRQRRRF